jgi:choline-glycine betaine transporter
MAHNVQSAVYSISLILLLWLVLILVSLVTGLRNGIRELKAQSNKIVFIKSCFLAVIILVVPEIFVLEKHINEQ